MNTRTSSLGLREQTLLQEKSLLHGTGEMADCIREFDWEQSALGSIQHWSSVLLSTVNLILPSPIASGVCWGPGMLMIYNDAYLQMTSLSPAATLGRPACEVWAEIWDRISARYEAVMHDGASFFEEEIMIPFLRNGRLTEHFWNYSLSPIYDGGQVAGILLTGQEVTNSVIAMRSMIASDERLRIALSANDCVGVWDWHIASDQVFAEERFALLYGTDPAKAATGVSIAYFLEQIHPDDQPLVFQAITDAVNTGKDYLCEYRILQPEGQIRWVQASGRCVYGLNGAPERFPGVTTDITRRKILENAAAPLNSPPVSALTLAAAHETARLLVENGRPATLSKGSSFSELIHAMHQLIDGIGMTQSAESVPQAAREAFRSSALRGTLPSSPPPDLSHREETLWQSLYATWVLLGEQLEGFGENGPHRQSAKQSLQ
jgi:PAS domain-containing protein